MYTKKILRADVHPVQTECCHRAGTCPKVVTMRAYEVYKHCFGAQEALITGDCRGGFGVGELVAFLYAYPFPKNEWHKRVDEAMRGFKLGVCRP